MAARIRVYTPVGTAEYAKLWGVSQSTARRRLAAMPGATRTGRGWRAPILATEYAKRAGVKSANVARRKSSLRAASPVDLADVIANRYIQPKRKRAHRNYRRLVGGASYYRDSTVQHRMENATPQQLTRIASLSQSDIYDILNDGAFEDDEWMGTDGYSVLYYR